MSFLERLTELSKTLLTADAGIKHLTERLNETRLSVSRLEVSLQDIRERLTRLETMREADRAQLAAEIAKFQAEATRVELRLSRLLSAPADSNEQTERS